MQTDFKIRAAHVADVPIILQLIRDLATYERAPNEVWATEEQLVDVLFGKKPAAEILLAFENETPVGFAVFFHNFSTWLGRPGLYLEDLFVKPEARGKGKPMDEWTVFRLTRDEIARLAETEQVEQEQE